MNIIWIIKEEARFTANGIFIWIYQRLQVGHILKRHRLLMDWVCLEIPPLGDLNLRAHYIESSIQNHYALFSSNDCTIWAHSMD